MKIRYYNNKKNQGFTLIEVVIAMGVFSFGILFMMQMLGGVALLSNDNNSQTKATEIAVSILDDIRSTPLPSGSSTSSASVRYQLPIPTNGQAQTLYFDLDGNATNAASAVYAASVNIATGTQKLASVASVIVYWPPNAAANSSNIVSHVEITSLINRS